MGVCFQTQTELEGCAILSPLPSMCICFINKPQGSATFNQYEFFSTKFLAFAAVGVKPEPKAWPGKATLRPVCIKEQLINCRQENKRHR